MTPDSPIAHARSYPFFIPDNSFVLTAGGHQDLRPGSRYWDFGGRTPVLACGSNQSPDQLSRKFKDLNSEPIPVTKIWLRDFDAVYSAHFTSYGSIAATLQTSPGTEVSLSITWLTAGQLARMHETESLGVNYDFGCLHGVTIGLEDGTRFNSVYTYNSRRGCLNLAGEPVALKEVQARNRRFKSQTQFETLEYAASRLAPDRSTDAFISENITTTDLRLSRTNALALDAVPFAHADYEITSH